MSENKFHIDEDCTNLTGDHEDKVFFNCKFKNLTGLTLKNCDLNRSQFLTDNVEELLDFTITLNCHSFDNVELSDLIFDLILILLMKTKGNTEKRKKLIQIVGKERVIELLKKLATLER